MKALIIGANGQVGRKLTAKMRNSDDWQPIALLRKEDQQEYFNEQGVESRVVSLEENTETLAEKMKEVDAVVFTAGSGPDTGLDKTMSVDLDGAVKAMEAAKQEGINRFVIVSAMNTGDKSSWEDSKMKPYYIAKYYADEWLKNSGLDYTILRPGRLKDEKGTGKVTVIHPEDKEGVPREDVADMILETLRQASSKNKIISFNEGEVPVNEAVSQAT